jgi:hypothetical protein
MNNLVAFLWYDKLAQKWETAVTLDEEAFDKLLCTNPNVGVRQKVSVAYLVEEYFHNRNK